MHASRGVVEETETGLSAFSVLERSEMSRKSSSMDASLMIITVMVALPAL